LTARGESTFGHWSPLRLFGLAFGVLLWLLITKTMVDPDLWGHLRFGLDMLASRTIPATDSYSFTSDRLWVNHEWLSELLMAVAYKCGGVLGLNLLKLSAIWLLATTIAGALRQESSTHGARIVLLGLTVFVSYTRMQVIRPQIFAVALFALVLYAMRQFDRGRHRAIWALPPCFVLWVNLHGSWIVGLTVVAVWLGVALYEREQTERRTVLISAGIVTVLATLVNPYGLGLWKFLLETVRFNRTDISEWQPLLELPLLILVIEGILPALALLSLFRTRQRVRARYVVILLVLWIATFKTSRVDAFAQQATAVLLAPQLLTGLQFLADRLRSRFWRTTVVMNVIPAMAAGVFFVVGAGQLREIPVEGSWVPDHEAAAFLRAAAPGGRVLTWFNWGEYAIWQLAPVGVTVSIDGRRETVYSADVLRGHWEFYNGTVEGLEYPDRIRADYIWLPLDLPVVDALPERGWFTVFKSSRSVVYSRLRPDSSRGGVELPEPRAFPWP